MTLAYAAGWAGGAALAYAFDPTKRVVALRSQLPLINAGAPIQWIDVAYEGQWCGHSSGPFEFTRDNFAMAVRNFDRQQNAIKLDFDHETDYAPLGASVPARGWIHRLEVREGDGGAHLWALTEFGAEAVAKNRAGGYRFCSGVFDFDARDRVTGEPIGLALLRVGLTDDPFIDGQAPIMLSRPPITQAPAEMSAAQLDSTGDRMMKINKAELLAAVRKLDGEELDVDQVAKLAQALAMMAEATSPPASADAGAQPAPMSATDNAITTLSVAPAVAPVSTALDAPPPAADAQPVQEGETAPADLLQQVMDATGLDLNALIAALQSMLAGQMPAAPAPLSATSREVEVMLGARDQKIAVLTDRMTKAEAALVQYREREADQQVDVLVESGRLLDTGRPFARGLFLSDRARFDEYVASLPAIVPLGAHASGHTPPTEQTPAIDEDDPGTKSLRRMLGNTRLSKAAQDAAIAKDIARRKANGGQRV